MVCAGALFPHTIYSSVCISCVAVKARCKPPRSFFIASLPITLLHQKVCNKRQGKKLNLGYFFVSWWPAVCRQEPLQLSLLGGEEEGAERIKKPFCVSGVTATHFRMRWFSSTRRRLRFSVIFASFDNVV